MTIESISKLFKKEIKFIAGAAQIKQIPKFNLPEIAFIGKSNVGKSSLINMLCGRKTLAKVSHNPGRTQQINFFSVDDKMIIVDLPGYGFAKVPLAVKEKWGKLILHYLENRENLKLVNLLIDARRGIKEHDEQVAKLLLSFKKDFQIIFTKIDKMQNKQEVIESGKNFLETLGYSCNVFATSSRSKEGAKEFQHSLGCLRKANQS